MDPNNSSEMGTSPPQPEPTPVTGSIRDYLPDGKKALAKAEFKPSNMPLHRPLLPCKLIKVGNLHHRDVTGKVVTTTSKFVRELVSKEQPYKRSFVVGEQWIELNTAWIPFDKLGYLMLRNDGGIPFQVIPTEEQLKEARSRVIDVGYMLMDFTLNNVEQQSNNPVQKRKRTMWDKKEEPVITTVPILPLWWILPGESMEGCPTPEHPMYIRCRNGEVTLTVKAFPL